MVPELEKARVMELQVRMDCNGCVQKIKKAMHNIDGVYDVYIDFAQQKLTVVGRADPEKIMKAIKKTRKSATICSHTEPGGEPAANPENAPPAEPENQPPSEAPPAEAEPPKDGPPAGEKPEEVKPSPEAEASASAEPKDVGEVHMVHYYPQNYVNNLPIAPYYVTQSYSSYRPPAYVSGYGYGRPLIRFSGAEAYADDHYYYSRNQGGADGNNITSMFSDENPNACTIV